MGQVARRERSQTKGATGNAISFVSMLNKVTTEIAQEYRAPASGAGDGKHRPCSSPFIVNASSGVWRLAGRVGDSQIYLGDANGRAELYFHGVFASNVMFLHLNGKCGVYELKWVPPVGDDACLYLFSMTIIYTMDEFAFADVQPNMFVLLQRTRLTVVYSFEGCGVYLKYCRVWKIRRAPLPPPPPPPLPRGANIVINNTRPTESFVL